VQLHRSNRNSFAFLPTSSLLNIYRVDGGTFKHKWEKLPLCLKILVVGDLVKPPFVVSFAVVSAGADACRDGPSVVEVLCQDELSGREKSFLYQNN